jgi:hypothetical protein
MTAPGGLGPQTSLAPPYFIEVNVPGQEVYMGVRDISIFTIFLIEFGTAPTMLFFFFFITREHILLTMLLPNKVYFSVLLSQILVLYIFRH